MQRPRLPSAFDPAVRFVRDVMDDDVPELAAALAYRFLFALFPFVIFLAALTAFIAGWVGIDDPTGQILSGAADNLPPDVAQQLTPQLEAVLGETRPGLLSVGAIVALWAATGGVTSLISAMNKAYDVPESRPFVSRTALGVGLTLLASTGFLVAVVTIVGGSLLTEQAVATLGVGDDGWQVASLLRWPIVLAMVALAVAVLFRFGPNVAVSFRWTVAGGGLFAVTWSIATVVFGIYVANFANYANTYGALGGVVVLMLWFYITALLLLLAAELTSFLAKEHEPERIARGRQAATVMTGQGEGRATATGAPDGKAEGAPAQGNRPPGPRGAAPGRGANPLQPAGGRVLAAARVATPPPLTSRSPAPTAGPEDDVPTVNRQRRLGRIAALAVVLVAAVAGSVVGLVVGDDEAPARG